MRVEKKGQRDPIGFHRQGSRRRRDYRISEGFRDILEIDLGTSPIMRFIWQLVLVHERVERILASLEVTGVVLRYCLCPFQLGDYL